MAIDDNTSYELTGAQVKDLANKIKAKAADNIFVGATSAVAGVKGIVPEPQAGDDSKLLKGDGSWGAVTSSNIDWSTMNAASFSGEPSSTTLVTNFTNAGEYTIPKDGKYIVTGFMNISPSGLDYRVASVLKNNTRLSPGCQTKMSERYPATFFAAIDCAAGDKIKIGYYANSNNFYCFGYNWAVFRIA